MSKKVKKEGRRIRSLDPMHYVGIYLMQQRNDSTNYFSGTFDIGVAEDYIKEKREQGMKDFSIMHVFLASLVRMYSQHPEMNRFIRGLRIYARNDIEIAMTIKKEMKLNADDTVIKLNYEPDATAEEVYNITSATIDEALNEDSDFDDVVKTLCKLPRFVMRFIAWGLRTLDFYGIMPRDLVKVSPFHGSMVVTSLASLGIPPVYHHLSATSPCSSRSVNAIINMNSQKTERSKSILIWTIPLPVTNVSPTATPIRFRFAI